MQLCSASGDARRFHDAQDFDCGVPLRFSAAMKTGKSMRLQPLRYSTSKNPPSPAARVRFY
jgi:hypothetical protein